MDHCSHSVWIILLLLPVAMVTGAVPTVHHAVVCLVDDSPDSLQDELYLHCKNDGVINVLTAHHGYREQAADTKTCSLSPGPPGPCSADHPDFLQSVLSRCMGGSHCYVPVSRVFLDDCRKNSNYVHVEYECVPDNTVEPDNIVDVCGEMMQGIPVSRPSGYIKTPDYPELYPPDISCSCNLTALSSSAQIVLTMLDIKLEDPVDTDCKWDWLEYTTPVHGWGQGVRVCKQTHNAGPNNTFIGNKTVLLNFRADNKVEDRGFWLKYEGRNTVGDEVEVLLQCKNYQPDIVRRAAACVGDSGRSELFLDCRQGGVINVLSAQYGLISLGGSSDQCDYQTSPECMTSVTSDPGLLGRCMGQGACTVPVSPQPLPPCASGAPSDFMQVKYQCIPEAYEPTNIVDVCGDVLGGQAAFRHSGYVQSPNYPMTYPPNLSCQCLLSTDQDAVIRLRLLDVQLAADTVTGVCDADWLTYTTSHAATWGDGRKLCHEPRGRVVDTGTSEIRLDFYSDQGVEERGFWVHYSALRSDGLNVGVQIMCRLHQDPFVNDGSEGATPLKPGVNTALVAGLTVITVLIVVIILVLVILKYKRVQKGKTAETASTTPVIKKESTNFNKYSSFGQAQQNYRTLHNTTPTSLPNTDPQREYVEQHPDYDVTTSDYDATASRGDGGSPSYVNPAYDGTLEPSSFHNVAC